MLIPPTDLSPTLEESLPKMHTSLYEYAQRLRDALSNHTQFAAYNKDMRHASVVVCLAFEHAEEKILLLSHKLDRELYGSKWFMESAHGFLGKQQGKLEILVESNLEPDHPVVGLVADYRDQVSIKRVPDDLLGQYGYNYMVVDSKGYRFERDRKEPQAVVFFNEESDSHREFVEALEGNFAALTSLSEAVNLPAKA